MFFLNVFFIFNEKHDYTEMNPQIGGTFGKGIFPKKGKAESFHRSELDWVIGVSHFFLGYMSGR